MHSANLLIQRVFAGVIGKPFLRALIFPYFLFIFLISAADASTNWHAARVQVASLSPATKALIFVSLICAWCLIAGRALRPVWRHKTICFLVRQPIGAWEWSVRLLPSLSIALIPVVMIWWLASYGANPLMHYLGFVGLALPIILGASFSGFTSAAIVSTGVAVLTVLMLAYSYDASFAYLGLLVAPVLFRGTATFIRRQITIQSPPIRAELISASVVRVLVRRDWRCILRTRRHTLKELIILNLVMTLMMLGFRINGQDSGRDLLLTACVLFLIAALPAYRSLEVAKARLGAQMIRPEWPVTYSDRALAMIALTVILIGPGVVPIALVGSRMGLLNLFVFLVFVVTTAVFTATLFAKSLLRNSSSVGIFLNLILFHGVLVMVLTPWQYLLFALAGTLASFRLLLSGLKSFSTHSQRGISA